MTDQTIQMWYLDFVKENLWWQIYKRHIQMMDITLRIILFYPNEDWWLKNGNKICEVPKYGAKDQTKQVFYCSELKTPSCVTNPSLRQWCLVFLTYKYLRGWKDVIRGSWHEHVEFHPFHTLCLRTLDRLLPYMETADSSMQNRMWR